MMGWFANEKRVFGRLQLRGLSLVPNPPARTRAFKYVSPVLKFEIGLRSFPTLKNAL